jgi:hypothetical protein
VPLKHLKPFQVDPNRVITAEIQELVNILRNNSKVSEIQGIFDCNISLLAHLLRYGYIDYHEIYVLSTSLIDDPYRPDYICGCYHGRKGVSWYAIVCAGAQEQIWDDQLSLTTVGENSLDRLNYCVSNLGKILLEKKLVKEINPASIHGLLIIGQDRDFFRHPKKQSLKRDLNQKTALQIRTYGAFLRKFDKEKNRSGFGGLVDRLLERLQKRR